MKDFLGGNIQQHSNSTVKQVDNNRKVLLPIIEAIKTSIHGDEKTVMYFTYLTRLKTFSIGCKMKIFCTLCHYRLFMLALISVMGTHLLK